MGIMHSNGLLWKIVIETDIHVNNKYTDKTVRGDNSVKKTKENKPMQQERQEFPMLNQTESTCCQSKHLQDQKLV